MCVQELQHQCPLLTSRIQEGAFTPMEVPTLPIHTPGDTNHTGGQWWHRYSSDSVTAGNLLHTRLDPDQGPLWLVQIVSLATFEAASPGLSLGPEMEAILQDDSDTETRWRYYLRYLQVRRSGY